MTDDPLRHGPSRLEALIASGTPGALDLVARAHSAVGSPSVRIDLPTGPWKGRAILVDARDAIVAAHVAVDGGTTRMTLRALPHGRAWLMPPTETCIRVLETGTPVEAQQVAWPDPFRHLPVGVHDLGDLVGVVMPSPAALGALLDDPSGPLDEDLCRGVKVAAWNVALRHLLAGTPRDRRDLAEPVLPWDAVANVDHLVALLACLSLPNPSWVAAGVRRHPILHDLFARPNSTGEAAHAALTALAGGTAPFVAARTAVMEALYVDGFGAVPADAVVLGLANLRGTEDMMPGSLAHVARMLGIFHSGRPSHRALSVSEMQAVTAAADSWMSARVGKGVDLVACMLDAGAVGPFPDGLGDAWESLLDSLFALRSLRDDVVPSVDDVAFPPGRSLSSLRRIDREWHARVDRHRAALDAVADAARARRTVGVPPGRPFPHFITGPERVGDVVATPMLDREAFRSEGKALSHCVADHVDRARVGRVQCVSLAGPGDLRSTAEFSCEHGMARLVQHKGPANARPSEAHARAVASLLSRLATDGDAMARIGTERRRWEAHAGGDGGPVPEGATAAERAALVEAHFRNVSLWLPPSVAALGATAWARSTPAPSKVAPTRASPGILARLSARLPGWAARRRTSAG